MRRYLLITVIALLVLFAATAGIGWYLLSNEAFLKSKLSSLALRYTGRELTIEGPLRLSLGRETTLDAREIHFANATWADQPDMVAIGHLLLSVELSSLFGDKPVFPVFVLEDCSVSVIKNDAGEINWKMVPDSQAVPEPEPEQKKPPRRDPPIWMKDLKVSNCQVHLDGPRLDHPLEIRISDLAMEHHDDNRWVSKGSGSINEAALSLDGWFAPFSAIFLGGPLEHDLNISLGDITLQSSGTVKDAATWTGADLSAQLHGPEIADILEEFSLPPFSEGPYDFTLRLNSEGEMTHLDLNGDLGSLEIKAKGDLDRLIKPRKGSVELSVDGPNLGALAKVFDIDGLVEDSFSHVTHAAFKGDAIHFKKTTLTTDSDHLEISGHFNTGPGFSGTELDIHFETLEIGRWATAVGQQEQAAGAVTLDGKLSSDSSGLISIESKVVHGESVIDVKGTLGHLPDAFAPDLNVSFKSPDPSPLAAIAGLKDFPAAPLDIRGQLGFKDNQVQLGDVRIVLAGSKAEIDGHLSLKKRYAGSKIRLAIDIDNVEELGRLFGREGFPDQPMQLTAVLEPEGKGLAFRMNDGNLGEIQLDFDGHIADLEQLDGLDANFDIDLPRLDGLTFLIPDTDWPAAPFSAHGRVEMKDGKIQLENVRMDLAGNKAVVEGRINLVDHYAGSRLNIDIDIKHAGDFGRLFGKDGLPDQPMQLKAVLKPREKGLEFRVNDGNLGDIQLELDGYIADLEKPLRVDANFDIKLPRLSDLSFLFPDKDLPDLPFAANGRLNNKKTRTRLDHVQLELGQIKATIDGNLLPDDRFQLTINATGPDASRLDKLVGTSLPPKPFSLATGLNGSPTEFELKGLSLSLGRSQADGDLTIRLGDVKQIKGKIDSPHLDLSHWYSDENYKPEPKPASKAEWMFDDTQVMTFAGHGLDIDLDLQVDVLDLGNTTVEEIGLGFILSNQLLKLDPFTFKGTQGGRYDGEFSIDGRGSVPKLHLEASGTDVRLGLAAVPGQDPSTYPPIDLDIALDGVGATRRELASSMDGKVRVYLGKGQLASAGLDLLFSDFLTQLSKSLNPYHETSEYTQLDCAVLAADAEAGMVKVFPVIYHTEQLTILSDGTVDLNTEKINFSFNTKPRTGIGLSAGALINPLIKVGGRLTAPAVEMDPAGTVVSGGLAVATIGISVLAKSWSDRFLSSKDPCGDARKEITKRDNAAN